MDTSCVLEAVQMAGRISLESGGETYRVEDTMERMARAFGCAKVEVFAVPSGVFVTLGFADGTERTAVQRVRHRSTQLQKVDEVNQVSRAAAEGSLDPAAALARLKEIDGRRMGRGWKLIWAAGLSSGSFAVLFGGGPPEAAASFLCAVITQGLNRLLEKNSMNQVVSSLLGGGICALLPLLFHKFTGLGSVEAMVAGALMPLLPGFAMTNAVRDTMRGDLLSGVTHAAQALLTCALVAGGALMAQRLFLLLEGGL